MHTGLYRLYLHRPDRTRAGRIGVFRRLQLVIRHNAGGTWELDGDSREPIFHEFTWGSRLVVERTDAAPGDPPVFSGLMLRRRRQRAEHTIKLFGIDDTALLGSRLAFPVLDGPPFDTSSHDTFTGAAETGLHYYVGRNAAGAAVQQRQIAGLVLDGDGGNGEQVTANARFANLLTLLGEIAEQGGGVGFRVILDGPALRFQTFVPEDRSAAVRFSDGRRNLIDWQYEERAPVATWGLAAGGGEMELRAFVSYEDTAAMLQYGGLRWEVFRDARDTIDGPLLLQRARQELSESGPRTALSITPRDTGRLAYMRDYRVGHRVAVEIEGETITDVVREVHLTIGAGGVTVEPVIGTPNAEHPRVPDFFAALARTVRAATRLQTER